MRKFYTTFLIGFALITLFGGLYLYFFNTSHTFADTPVSANSALSSSANISVIGNQNDDQINTDTAFLKTLTALTKIKIDPMLFEDTSFKALRDNTVTIEPVTPGRTNPFAPIEQQATVSDTVPLVPVVTNQALQVANRTAVLSGTINTTSPVASSYFEYGPTETLGKITLGVTQSLVNTFVTKVSGLSPQTKYFYRAAAKINGVVIYGDLVSFTTN